MAFTGVAALVAASAETVTVAMVLTAVAEVGVALTVVGAVTGEKTLMKIGGAMTLIGGVGGFIAGAASGAAGAAAEAGLSEAATGAALDSASAEAAGALGGSAAADASTLDAIAGMEGAAGTGADLVASTAAPQGIVNSIAAPSQEMAQAVQPAARKAAETVVPDSIESVGGTSPSASTNGPAGPNAPSGPTGPAAPSEPIGARAPNNPFENPTDMRLASGTQTTPMSAATASTNAPEASGSFFSKLSTFAEKNKTLFTGGMNAVSGMLKGANESSIVDRKLALDRERLALVSHGNSVARFQPGGIVQGARA